MNHLQRQRRCIALFSINPALVALFHLRSAFTAAPLAGAPPRAPPEAAPPTADRMVLVQRVTDRPGDQANVELVCRRNVMPAKLALDEVYSYMGMDWDWVNRMIQRLCACAYILRENSSRTGSAFLARARWCARALLRARRAWRLPARASARASASALALASPACRRRSRSHRRRPGSGPCRKY